MMGRVTKNRTLIALYCIQAYVRTIERVRRVVARVYSSKAASHVFSDGICRCHWQNICGEGSSLSPRTELFQGRSQLHQEEEKLAAARVDCQAYRAG